MESAPNRLVVQALYRFRGTKNDELNLERSEIIVVTQAIEGGWWEGTLNGRTGWFPSNYVKEVKQDLRPSPMPNREAVKKYHQMVVTNLIESEKSHVNELESFCTKLLDPLRSAAILSASDYSKLTCNYQAIYVFHKQLLSALQETAQQALSKQRIGGLFLQGAGELKELLLVYCDNHPSAVDLLNARKDVLGPWLERQTASPGINDVEAAVSPELRQLTSGLSVPFRRLDKYPQLLKELERHMEESHVDRGDTQRSIEFYREMTVECLDLRRRRELQQELLRSVVDGLQGNLAEMGEPMLLSTCVLHQDDAAKDMLMMLFPGQLLLLAPTASGYALDSSIPLPVRVDRLDQQKLRISWQAGSVQLSCASAADQETWCDKMLQASELVAQVCQVPQAPARTSTPREMPLVPRVSLESSSGPWLFSCVRPHPPLRPRPSQDGSTLRRPRQGSSSLGRTSYEEDALILRVIEAYCATRGRQTVNSSTLTSPPVLIAEEEKIIIEDPDGVVQEKTLVDTVYSLRDQVARLSEATTRLQRGLDEERAARKRLEVLLKRSLRQLMDINNDEQ